MTQPGPPGLLSPAVRAARLVEQSRLARAHAERIRERTLRLVAQSRECSARSRSALERRGPAAGTP